MRITDCQRPVDILNGHACLLNVEPILGDSKAVEHTQPTSQAGLGVTGKAPDIALNLETCVDGCLELLSGVAPTVETGDRLDDHEAPVLALERADRSLGQGALNVRQVSAVWRARRVRALAPGRHRGPERLGHMSLQPSFGAQPTPA